MLPWCMLDSTRIRQAVEADFCSPAGGADPLCPTHDQEQYAQKKQSEAQ